MKTLFQNKTDLDPGRLRFDIKFFEQTASINDFGDQSVTEELVLQTRASRSAIQNRGPNSAYTQLEQEAGATLLNDDTYYTIRYRDNWRPKKNMRVEVTINGIVMSYTIRAIIPLDEPVHYWRLLCTSNQNGI